MISMLEKIREMKKTGRLSPPVVSCSNASSMTINEALIKLGHTTFRPHQEDVVKEVLGGRNGVLGVFPTGYGKSAVYQIPAIISDGMTIVVSPLISLMKDQVDKLVSLGVKAFLLNSSLTQAQATEVLAEVIGDGVKVLYVAPERFGNEEFNRCIFGKKVSLLAIDEAHCISRWGGDFRPSYSKLGMVIRRVRPRQVVALTATATKQVQDDICRSLGIIGAKRFVVGIHRPNLHMAVISGFGNSRLEALAMIVKEHAAEGHHTGIVYTQTRSGADSTKEYLLNRGLKATSYHGGLSAKRRTEIQNQWAANGGVIIATNAFGLGIDKPDVRFVVHMGLTGSIEDWYQEVGRAGRDGKDSLCVSFYDHEYDYGVQMVLIDRTNPTGRDVEMFWTWLRDVASREAKSGCQSVVVNMTQDEMGEHSGCVNVPGCMAFLRRSRLVKTLGRGRYNVSLRAHRDFDYGVLNKARQDKILKLDEVVALYRSVECRAAYVCNYFGDTFFHGTCGVCDNCKDKQQ